MAHILIPSIRPAARVVDIDFDGEQSASSRRLPLRSGQLCELRVDGESGPQLVCRLERGSGPLIATTALEQGVGSDRYDVLVDGKELRASRQTVVPGSSVAVIERGTGRRYEAVVTEPAWYARPRLLAFIVTALTALGVAYGAYLYVTLSSARSDLEATRQRLGETVDDIRRAERLLDEVQARVLSVRGDVARSVARLKEIHSTRDRAMRTEFNVRLQALASAAEARLEELSHQGSDAREVLGAQVEQQLRTEVAAVREEFAERMVEAYRSFKHVEEQLQRKLREQASRMEPPGPRFKTVLARAREAIIYLRTTYEVDFAGRSEPTVQETLGSGFLIGADGTALTARHVLRPWEYEQQLQVLVRLGLAKIKTGSARWYAWPFGTMVRPPAGADAPEALVLEGALRSDTPRPGLRVHYISPIRKQLVMAASPLGPVEVDMPVPGRSDVAVFQLLRFGAPWPSLVLGAAQRRAAQLDDVMAVGYPMSLLAQGRAQPQGVTGLVRRDSGEWLELNIAFDPGVSGGPILDRAGEVIGLASGMVGSMDYGLAVRIADLTEAQAAAARAIAAEEGRLRDLGCDPGDVDGRFDARTQAAYECSRSRRSKSP